MGDEACTKCGGSGHLPKFQHVEAGVCFRCEGTGIQPVREPMSHETKPVTTFEPKPSRELEKARAQLEGLRRQYRALKDAVRATRGATKEDLIQRLSATTREGKAMADLVKELSRTPQ